MSHTSGIGSQETANKVNPSEVNPAVSVNTRRIGADKSEPVSATVGHADQTALSSTGGLVFQTLGASDTRTTKVSSLQEAIAAGRYTVSPSDVAEKIIQSLLK